MKKLMFLAGGAIGFMLGSYAGRQPYEQLAAKTQQVMGRPETHDVLNRAKEAAQSAAGQASDKASSPSGIVP